MAHSTPIYQLKITLQEIRPPVWRRVLVPADITLPRLHRVFQTVFGWENYHLHTFEVEDTTYGEPDPDFDEPRIENERRVRLSGILPAAAASCLYRYDFGDNWRHEVVVEKILPAEPWMVYPLCVGGKRACPPEDCGGVSGYERFLEAIADPEHEEHEEYLSWIGGAFDPEGFDQNMVNRALRRLR